MPAFPAQQMLYHQLFWVHENSGVVAEIGSSVTNVKVGDRVTVDPNIYCGQCKYCRTGRPELCENLSAVGVTRNGGFEEYFTAPASVVYQIPDNVSLKSAAVVEPISCAVHGIKLLKVTPYQKALVIVMDLWVNYLFNFASLWHSPSRFGRYCS